MLRTYRGPARRTSAERANGRGCKPIGPDWSAAGVTWPARVTRRSRSPARRSPRLAGRSPGCPSNHHRRLLHCGMKEARMPKGMWWFGFAGVILPVVTLGFELVTGMCADTLFDPLATWTHVLAVALVPALNFATLRALHAGRMLSRRHGWVFGVGFGVSLYYALLFLPLVPAALVGIMFMGLGLLALSPLFASVAGVGMFKQLRLRQVSRGSVAAGVIAGWGLLLSAEAWPLANDVMLSLAASSESKQSAEGVRRLRRWGDHDQLLEACYRSRGDAAGLAGFVHRKLADMPSPMQARQIYYRVYGKPFSLEPSPPERGLWGGRRATGMDESQGGRSVAGRVEQLRLRSSRLDGSVDAVAAVGYVEWTLELANAHESVNAEARAELALPSGGTVSRATLWVDGEPREAAFAGTGKVREAYQRVVQRQRDPLLVTQTSPERVLVQCFPVPAGGTMKVRVGITFPLLPEGDDRSVYTLPYFTDHNFEIADDLKHAVWFESAAPIQLGQSRGETRLRRALETWELRTAALSSPWQSQQGQHTSLALDGEGAVVKQRHERRELAKPRHLVMVIDASSSLADQTAAIRRTLVRAHLGTIPTSLVFATDAAPVTHELASGAALSRAFAGMEFEGGRDNAAALSLAMDIALEHGAEQVLWLHGPQPEAFGGMEAVNQIFERGDAAPTLVPFALAAGENTLLGALGDEAKVQQPVRRGDGLSELEYHLRSYGQSRWQPVRWREERPRPLDAPADGEHPPQPAPNADTGRHLVRLWAAEHVAAGCAGLPAQQCQTLAASYQLVSAVSGAVVLESQEQYAAAGLAPVDPATVPSVPEPQEWLLMITLALALLWLSAKQRRAQAWSAAQ
jgi:hypothetical protein